MRPSRRHVLFALVLAAACSRTGDRCAFCGMKIDPASAFRAELVRDGKTRAFDAPRCAFGARLAEGSSDRLRVQEYYDRAWRDAAEVRFVVKSDVQGPMGPDLVPVDPARVTKFIADHAPGQGRALAASDVTKDVLAELR
jgi:nitrous oxide reductase accessory protein NosL